MPPGRTGGLAVLMIAVLVLVNAAGTPASAATPLLSQVMPTIAAQAAGPPCVVGGSPDERLCVSSDQDNYSPPGDPWISAVRWNTTANWTFAYGAWAANGSAMAVFSNVRSVTADLGLDGILHGIANASEDAGARMTWNLEADTPYVSFTVRDIARPAALTWRGAAVQYGYSAAGNGTLTFALPFSDGALWFDFPAPTPGGSPQSPPSLPGLTNFPQLDLVPDVGQIASFSCGNVTLQDPRDPASVADTRLWVFGWGDGTPPTRVGVPIASHLYARPGVYAVTMTVQDASGQVASYSGSVDTTPGACAFHVVRQIGFVVLAGTSVVLLACSFLLPRRTKKEKRRMRRQAVYAFAAVVILAVVL